MPFSSTGSESRSRAHSARGNRPRPFSANPDFFAGAHKAQLEAAIVRRRDLEREKTEYWSRATDYYDRIERNNQRYNAWTSDEAQRACVEGYEKKLSAEARSKNLLVRRERLRALLKREREQYESELIKTRTTGGVVQPTILDLRAAREQMKKERDEELRKEAEDKMVQHFKINNPEFREIQLKKHRELVQKAWDEQRVERERQRREDEERENEEMRIRVEENVRAEILEQEAERRRLERLEKWKASVLDQIETLRAKQRRHKELEDLMADEEKRRQEIEKVEEGRKRREEKRNKMEFGHYLQRQHKLRLRAEAARVQRELDDDRRALDELQKIEEARQEHQEEEKRSNKDIQWMRNVLVQQKEEEKRRMKELDLLFAEETEHFWERQDRIWKDERRARNKLMEDVIAGWKEQCEEKITAAKEEEERVAAEKTRLESEVKRLNKEIVLEEKAKERRREAFVRGLEQQLAEKKTDQLSDRKHEEAEAFKRDNELAAKLAQWNISEEEVITDFRRRRAKWF